MTQTTQETRQMQWPFVRVALLSVLLCLVVGCGSDNGTDQPVTTSPEPEGAAPTPTPVHVALAGGGWRAHTAHAAWTMSLLDDGANTLELVFENVETFSSNSGGSWFLSMLAFSSAFRSSLEAQGAFSNYAGPNGYLGREQALFDDFDATLVAAANWCPFQDSEPLLYFYCRLASLSGDAALVWTDIVNNVVFQPFGMAKELADAPTLLSGTRQPWAVDKSLLIASTMLTDKAVLTETDIVLDKLYYDATLSGSGPEQVNVTPVTFASVPASKIMPPFLSAGEFIASYADADDTESASADFMQPTGSENVPVLLATAASSAAVGSLASYSVLFANGYQDLTWELAYELSDLSVPFKIDSPLAGGSPADLSLAQLAAAKFARLADGGYQDNSGVAQLLSFLQANGEGTGFQIVAFDNIQQLYTPRASGAVTPAPVGKDIALLFGEGGQNQVCAGTGSDEFCVSVPAQQVFAADPLETTAATWEWTSPGATGPTLVYTQYAVTTVGNASIGLQAGSTGVLHVFTCAWPAADTAPWNGASDFDAYAAMLTAIGSGLRANEGEGLNHLRAALSGQ